MYQLQKPIFPFWKIKQKLSCSSITAKNSKNVIFLEFIEIKVLHPKFRNLKDNIVLQLSI